MKKPWKRHHSKATPEKAHDARADFSRQVKVLYEDDFLIVVDKPPGLLAVPIKGSRAPSALSVLTAKFQDHRGRAYVVHRIDRFASGALLFAKTPADRHNLIQQFLAHTPKRQYLAVVRGRVAKQTDTLVHHFRRQGMHQQLRTTRDSKASRAELRYAVERVFANATLVRVELETGLQNQIRAQFAALGHPIIGDRKYHREEAREQMIARVALHAENLQFIHPRTGETLSVHCKPPDDFRYLIRMLAHAKPSK
jgi:23S rRNA pseudouridine1911/1915/1917 synthase